MAAVRERRHEVLRRQNFAALLQVRKVDTRLRELPRDFRTSSPGPIACRSDESDVARNATVKMFNDLRVAFGELIDEADWMDNGEKEGEHSTTSCRHYVRNLSDAQLREGEAVRRDADRGLQGGGVADGGVHAAGLLGNGGHVGGALL